MNTNCFLLTRYISLRLLGGMASAFLARARMGQSFLCMYLLSFVGPRPTRGLCAGGLRRRDVGS